MSFSWATNWSLIRGCAALIAQLIPLQSGATVGLAPLDGLVAAWIGFLDLGSAVLYVFGSVTVTLPSKRSWYMLRRLDREHGDVGRAFNQLFDSIAFRCPDRPFLGTSHEYRVSLVRLESSSIGDEVAREEVPVQTTRATSQWICALSSTTQQQIHWQARKVKCAAVVTVSWAVLVSVLILGTAAGLGYACHVVDRDGPLEEKIIFDVTLGARALLSLSQVWSALTYSLWHKGLVVPWTLGAALRLDSSEGGGHYNRVPWLWGFRIVRYHDMNDYVLQRRRDNKDQKNVNLRFPRYLEAHFQIALSAQPAYKLLLAAWTLVSLVQIAALAVSFVDGDDHAFVKNYVAFSGWVCPVVAPLIAGPAINVAMDS